MIERDRAMAKRSAADARALALASVVGERERQRHGEHMSAAHDDAHYPGDLAKASAAYALEAARKLGVIEDGVYEPRERGAEPHFWPWESVWWKPKDPRRDLVRAAALLLAEIERIDRRGE